MNLKQILHTLVEAASGEASTLEKDARQEIHDAIDKLEDSILAPAAPPASPAQPDPGAAEQPPAE